MDPINLSQGTVLEDCKFWQYQGSFSASRFQVNLAKQGLFRPAVVPEGGLKDWG
jgi:hypothetical protein